MTPDPHDDSSALEMLVMPRVHTLAADQIEGSACVWCASQPKDGTALRLGPRIRIAEDGVRRWWPRACRPCAAAEAGRVYEVHIHSCGRCSHRQYCADSRALYRLANGSP